MVQSRFLQLFLALLLGAAMPLSFAPFNLAFLAPFSLAFLLVLAYQQSAKRAALLGLLFGFGMFSWGIWWIRISLIEFGGAPLILGGLLALLLAFYLALYYAVLLYLTTKITWRNPLKYGVFFPVMAVLLEYLRSVLFSGFPWLALGYSLTDLPVASWLFPQMGALMASFWIYWFAGLLFMMWKILFIQKGNTTGKFFLRRLIPSFSLLILVGGMVVISANWIGGKIRPAYSAFPVALVQGNISQSLKFSAAQYQYIVDTYRHLTDEVAPTVELVIWPETAIPDLYERELDIASYAKNIAEKEEATVMTGIFSSDGQSIRNSIIAYSQAGQAGDQRYDKVHLVPFGEYLPLRSLLAIFSSVIEIPYSDLAQGAEKQAPLKVNAGPLESDIYAGPSICYEAVFGDELRYQGENAHFLVNVSNDAWFGDSIGPWQHFQIARARAIELQREMVRATNNGITAFISKNGVVKAILPQFTQGVLVADVTPLSGQTSYSKLGDLFWGVLFGVLLIIAYGEHRFWLKRHSR